MKKRQMRTELNIVNQNGAALLIMATILAVGVSSFLIGALSLNKKQLDTAFHNGEQFEKAKKALIGYAANSDQITSQAGYLPCPDRNGDGIAESSCGNDNRTVTGWLPWQTLGLSPLKDASGTCLRYTVSGNFKLGSTTTIIKSPPTEGQLVLHDLNNNVIGGSDKMIAVIFAPGAPLSGQDRSIGTGTETTCSSSSLTAPANRSENYLDTLSRVNNAQGSYGGSPTLPTALDSYYIFAAADKSAPFNDSIAWISEQNFSVVFNRIP